MFSGVCNIRTFHTGGQLTDVQSVRKLREKRRVNFPKGPGNFMMTNSERGLTSDLPNSLHCRENIAVKTKLGIDTLLKSCMHCIKDVFRHACF